jgi:hypothetical protein
MVASDTLQLDSVSDVRKLAILKDHEVILNNTHGELDRLLIYQEGRG